MNLNLKLKKNGKLYKFVSLDRELMTAIIEDETGKQLEVSENEVDFT